MGLLYLGAWRRGYFSVLVVPFRPKSCTHIYIIYYIYILYISRRNMVFFPSAFFLNTQQRSCTTTPYSQLILANSFLTTAWQQKAHTIFSVRIRQAHRAINPRHFNPQNLSPPPRAHTALHMASFFRPNHPLTASLCILLENNRPKDYIIIVKNIIRRGFRYIYGHTRPSTRPVIRRDVTKTGYISGEYPTNIYLYIYKTKNRYPSL